MAEQTPITLDGLLSLQAQVTEAEGEVTRADKDVESAEKRALKKRNEFQGLKAQLEKAKAALAGQQKK